MKKKVLLVDDDMDDREIFIEAVANIDVPCDCITADNGADAINLLNSGTTFPDFIFLDLNMPRMNGRECLVEIKRIKHLKQIPVIIYTTSSLPKEKEELTRLGATRFITKPSNFNDLCESISQIICSSPRIPAALTAY